MSSMIISGGKTTLLQTKQQYDCRGVAIKVLFATPLTKYVFLQHEVFPRREALFFNICWGANVSPMLALQRQHGPDLQVSDFRSLWG